MTQRSILRGKGAARAPRVNTSSGLVSKLGENAALSTKVTREKNTLPGFDAHLEILALANVLGLDRFPFSAVLSRKTLFPLWLLS